MKSIHYSPQHWLSYRVKALRIIPDCGQRPTGGPLGADLIRGSLPGITVGPASSELGESLARGALLGSSCSSDFLWRTGCLQAGAVHQINSVYSDTLVRLASGLTCYGCNPPIFWQFRNLRSVFYPILIIICIYSQLGLRSRPFTLSTSGHLSSKLLNTACAAIRS